MPFPTDELPRDLIDALPEPEGVELVEHDDYVSISIPRRNAVQAHSLKALALVSAIGSMHLVGMVGAMVDTFSRGGAFPFAALMMTLAMAGVVVGLPAWYAWINLRNTVTITRDRYFVSVEEGPTPGTIRKTVASGGLDHIAYDEGVGRVPGKLLAVYRDGRRDVILDRLKDDRVGHWLETRMRLASQTPEEQVDADGAAVGAAARRQPQTG